LSLTIGEPIKIEKLRAPRVDIEEWKLVLTNIPLGHAQQVNISYGKAKQVIEELEKAQHINKGAYRALTITTKKKGSKRGVYILHIKEEED